MHEPIRLKISEPAIKNLIKQLRSGGNYSNTLVAKINFSFHQGSSNEVMVTPFEEDAWINLLFPIYMPEWVMKRCVSYVLIKKTRSPFISPFMPDINFPYLACSPALWGR
jgi:hypothetical protein